MKINFLILEKTHFIIFVLLKIYTHYINKVNLYTQKSQIWKTNNYYN